MASRPNREITQVEAAREDFICGQKFVGYGQDRLLVRFDSHVSQPKRGVGELICSGFPRSLVAFSLTVTIGA